MMNKQEIVLTFHFSVRKIPTFPSWSLLEPNVDLYVMAFIRGRPTDSCSDVHLSCSHTCMKNTDNMICTYVYS